MRLGNWIFHPDPYTHQNPVFQVKNTAVRLAAYIEGGQTPQVQILIGDDPSDPSAFWADFVQNGHEVILGDPHATQVVIAQAGWYRVDIDDIHGTNSLIWREDEEGSMDSKILPVHIIRPACGGGASPPAPVDPILVTCAELAGLISASQLQPGATYGVTDATPTVSPGQIFYVEAVSAGEIARAGHLSVPTLDPGRLWPAVVASPNCELVRVHDTTNDNVVEGTAAIAAFPWDYVAIGSTYRGVRVKDTPIQDAGGSTVENCVFVGGSCIINGTVLINGRLNNAAIDLWRCSFTNFEFDDSFIMSYGDSVDGSYIYFNKSFVELDTVYRFENIWADTGYMYLYQSAISNFYGANDYELYIEDCDIADVSCVGNSQLFLFNVGSTFFYGDSSSIHARGGSTVDIVGIAPLSTMLTLYNLVVDGGSQFLIQNPQDEEGFPFYRNIRVSDASIVQAQMVSSFYRLTVEAASRLLISVFGGTPQNVVGANFSEVVFSGTTARFEWVNGENCNIDQSTFTDAEITWRQWFTRFSKVSVDSGAIFDFTGGPQFVRRSIDLDYVSISSGGAFYFAPRQSVWVYVLRTTSITSGSVWYAAHNYPTPDGSSFSHSNNSLESSSRMIEYGSSSAFTCSVNYCSLHFGFVYAYGPGRWYLVSLRVHDGYVFSIPAATAGYFQIRECEVSGRLQVSANNINVASAYRLNVGSTATSVVITLGGTTPNTASATIRHGTFFHDGLVTIRIGNPGSNLVVRGLHSQGYIPTLYPVVYTTNFSAPFASNF